MDTTTERSALHRAGDGAGAFSYQLEGFIYKTARWMRGSFGVDVEEAIAAGRMAVLIAMRDGEIAGNAISDRAKRFIRREMVRAASPKPEHQQLPDHGYEDGNVLRRKQSGFRSYCTIRRNRRLAGLCPSCGKRPESDRVHCDGCRRRISERGRQRRYRETN